MPIANIRGLTSVFALNASLLNAGWQIRGKVFTSAESVFSVSGGKKERVVMLLSGIDLFFNDINSCVYGKRTQLFTQYVTAATDILQWPKQVLLFCAVVSSSLSVVNCQGILL